MPNYYFLDTNIIIAYIDHIYLQLNIFIDDPNNKFYYTETVRKEMLTRPHQIPSVFNFVHSQISPNLIECAYKYLTLESGISFTPVQIQKFKNDITIIFEAGFTCYDITPLKDFTEPYLLTHNLKLYHKFIEDISNQKLVENAINLYGLEHLISIKRPKDVIRNFNPI